MDLGLLTADAYLVSKVACLALDLDAVSEELLEVLWLNDVIIGWLLAVQGELQGGLLALDRSLLLESFHHHGYKANKRTKVLAQI